VAYRWRIRHKLMLGLALVVAIVALLLVGTLMGLSSYQNTMRGMSSKLEELKAANELRDRIKALLVPNPERGNEEAEFLTALAAAKAALVKYQDQLNETIEQGQAPLGGVREQGHIDQITRQFEGLEKECEKLKNMVMVVQGPRPSVRNEKDIEPKLQYLWRTVDADLVNDVIYGDLTNRQKQAQHDYQVSLAIVLTISIAGVLLLAGLLRGFYSWIFSPIRDLKRGTDQIAQGDFAHTIEVHSGDEMQDLAAAFNHMTEQLRDIYGDLERQVNERSRQLVRSERLASVGFLAAGVAHEINNPLASIAFCSEALESRIGELFAQIDGTPVKPVLLQTANADQDRQTIKRYVEMIQKEAFRCKEITQKLLEFSRGGERKFEPVDLREIIQGVLDIAEHLENCRGKYMVYEPSTPLVAWVNAQEMKSVILNLVVNAIESMDEGGSLTIEHRQRDGLAEIMFTDTGCGMSGEVLENIFEPFYTQSRTGKGTGLGLSISHRIINQHGGEIEATSPGPGEGSTFIVRVPLRPREGTQPMGRELTETEIDLDQPRRAA
jgi:two-component system NtrC family sensor kinase